MGKGMNYFDYAENDYFFYRANYEEHRIGNAMCSSAQGICERYLKHLINTLRKVFKGLLYGRTRWV